MTLTADNDPWWLAWIVPVVAVVTALGGAMIWLGRVVLLPGIKGELEELLGEKFTQAHEEVMERHDQNQADIAQLRKLLDESAADRRQLRKDLAELLADVAYLRGKSSSGTSRKP